MGRFAVRRGMSMIVVLFFISIVTFGIFQVIPNGDPAVRLAGRTATPENIQAVRKTWHLDDPIYTQYWITMKKVFTGKVISYTQSLNVEGEIKRDLPVTMSLAIGAGIIWLFLGIVFGVLSAISAGRWLDRGLTILSLIGISTPVFFLGAVVLYFLGFKAGVIPNGNYTKFADSPWEWFKHLIAPWLCLSVLFIGFYSRVLRSNILDTINEDYVRTARAKGISERRVLLRHVVRNSLIPIISLWGLDFASVIGGGAILTESVFSLPGVGRYAATSVQSLDVPPVLVITMFGAFFVVLLGALTDVLYAVLDPRIRLTA